MGLFGSIFRAIVDTALLPFSVAKDVVTLGATAIGEEPASKKELKK